MKLTFTRAAALLALGLGLSGCGGKATFELGGPVTGLEYDNLAITNITNGDSVLVHPTSPVGATTFKLAKTLEYGQVYDVQISAQPRHQTCALSGGADTAGRLSSISIVVACAVQAFPISGTVTGLRTVADTTTQTDLIIANGTDNLTIKLDGTFTMPTPVPFGKTYGVAIASQPTGKTCKVDNASGTINTETVGTVTTDLVTNITITCS